MCLESNASFSLIDCGPAIPVEVQLLFCTVWISSAVLSSRAAPELFSNAVPPAASQMWLFRLNRVVEIAILPFFLVPTQGLTSCCWPWYWAGQEYIFSSIIHDSFIWIWLDSVHAVKTGALILRRTSTRRGSKMQAMVRASFLRMPFGESFASSL